MRANRTDGGLQSRLLWAAKAVGLLDQLSFYPQAPRVIAERLGAREAPIQALCQVLAVLGYLAGDAETGFLLPPLGAVPSAEGNRVDILSGVVAEWPSAEEILEGLRRPLGGKPTFYLASRSVETTVVTVRQRFPKANNVLVVGDPSGQVTEGFLRAGLTVSTAVGPGWDSLVPGGARRVAWGNDGSLGEFGLVALVQATLYAGWPENSMLFSRTARSLGRHGGIAVVDWLRDAGIGTALVYLVGALYAEEAQVYSDADFRMWMKSAGFAGITFHRLIPEGLQLVVAQKGGRG